ncbi:MULTISPECIES: MBL fold metallo-hydrolase [Sphingobacterium]|uniref:MBL fold metallo-hydrolase n=1 Tax=Sphingobacterium TaxID=28453 RepID=UPI0013DACF4B|nr:MULTISPECIES: MBL fold metallo-hydrolase [unclassified Sphingobacterium]
MFFQHVYDKTLAQASYIIGCQAKGEAIVIDPKRDIDTYLEIAAQNDLKITKVTETHIHADFLSGSRELVALTGAELLLSDEGGADWQYEFAHTGLKHGDVITLGNLTLEVLHTPGHTPESISFLLTDHPATSEPIMLFTGDFVFVGDVGRPDLLEKAAGMIGTQEKGAKQLFDSIKYFMSLPDHVQVWPGHGAGSACGKALGAVPSSTVGYEKIRNWALQYSDNEASFTKDLLDGQPEAPKYFAMMKKLNKVDRPLLTSVPQHKKLSREEFLKVYQEGMLIIDTRNKVAFAKGYLPNTLNIQGNNSFANWMGWIVSYDVPFVLIAEASAMEDLTRKLMRIGLDNIYGFIDVGENLGIDLQTVDVIDMDQFESAIREDNVLVVDVRNEKEFEAGHIEGAMHAFVGNLVSNLDKIDQSKDIVVHCQAGDRSTIAYSLLKKYGFKSVRNYAGGMKEWTTNGKSIVKH